MTVREAIYKCKDDLMVLIQEQTEEKKILRTPHSGVDDPGRLQASVMRRKSYICAHLTAYAKLRGGGQPHTPRDSFGFERMVARTLEKYPITEVVEEVA